MGKQVRFFLLGLQAALTISLSALVFHAFSVASATGIDKTLLISHFVPTIIHLAITLGAALLLCLFYRANIGAEAQLLPMLFLVMAFGNIRILPLYYETTHRMIFDPFWITVIPRFAFMFSAFLFLGSSLLQQESAAIKIGQYLGITATCSLFSSIITPMSTSNSFIQHEAYLENKPFLAVCLLLNILAVLSFLLFAYRDKGSSHILTRCVAFVLMILGNSIISVSKTGIEGILGLIIYTGGTVLLILVTRSYHIWT